MDGGLVGKIKTAIGWETATPVGKILMFAGVLLALGIIIQIGGGIL